jgi:quercetin dioxygenase-like cupin family protein
MAETIDWAERPVREVIPGFRGRFAHSDRMTFALWEVAEGAVLPLHAHPHEQVVHVLEGRFEVEAGGARTVLTAGMVHPIPGGLPHAGRALTACRILDVFAPVREDYRDGADPAATVIGRAFGGAPERS